MVGAPLVEAPLLLFLKSPKGARECQNWDLNLPACGVQAHVLTQPMEKEKGSPFYHDTR